MGNSARKVGEDGNGDRSVRKSTPSDSANASSCKVSAIPARSAHCQGLSPDAASHANLAITSWGARFWMLSTHRAQGEYSTATGSQFVVMYQHHERVAIHPNRPGNKYTPLVNKQCLATRAIAPSL